MSRRNTSASEAEHFFDEIAEISSLLPVWATLPVAALLFILVPLTDLTSLNFTDSSSVAKGFVIYFLLAVAKYLIPVALATGAIINILQRIKSYFLFGTIAKQGARKAIANLSWQDFEFLMFEWFKKQGYTAELTGGGGADGGVDIRLHKDGQLYLVQCKHYKAYRVPVMVVRELYGVMATQGAAGGFVVTSGRFTPDAYSFAKDTSIELIDGNKLVTMLDPSDIPQTQTSNSSETVCPKCGNKLIERSGKFGKFLGCSTYPKCNYTKAL